MAAPVPPLWDIPTRLCHWMMVLCLPLAWWSAEQGRYELHQWTGCTLIVLVLARITWGFIGSRHSRFSDFLVGPAKVLAYLRGQGSASVGHNPLGGWSVVALLALILLQAVSGLFNTDDVLFSGPLHYSAGTGFRDAMGVVHEVVFNGLLALVGLHILAVLYHQLRGGEKLLQAMIRGSATGRRGQAAPVAWWLAVVLVAVIGLALWWGLEQAPQPQPMQW